MTLCAISLGGNLGDVPRTFAAAKELLETAAGIDRVRFSRRYRTVPMGEVAGDLFENSAAVFETDLDSGDLLNLLQDIEQRCGRVRTLRWGPRTLDLDLILYGDEIIDSARLTVPHPAMWYRRFVLDPLAELIPDALHPVFRQTVREIRVRLLDRPLPVGWAVPTSLGSLAELAGTAHATVRWLPNDPQVLDSAAIIFTGANCDLTSPRIIHLPDQPAAAKQAVTDVLTAALDEPVPAP